MLLATFMVVDLRRIRLDGARNEAEKLEEQAQVEAQSDKYHSEDKSDESTSPVDGADVDAVGASVAALESPAALAQEDASQVSSPAFTVTVSKSNADPESDSEEDTHDADSEVDSASGSDSDSVPLLLDGAEEDPEGLCMALQDVLEPFRGLWFITRGDSEEHEAYNYDVQPRLFCRKVEPHATVKDLLEQVHDYKGGHNSGGDDDKPNRSYFNSSYSEDNLLEWFECDEEDEESDGDDVNDDISDGIPDGFDVLACEVRKEVAMKVQSLFAQHGKEQFFYRLELHEHDEGIVTTDGIGVVTASGFAVGIEASPVYWDP